MPIYHYHAMKQTATGMVANIDGIATMQKPVLTMQDYMGLKKQIAEGQDIGGEKGLTICSLTLLQD